MVPPGVASRMVVSPCGGRLVACYGRGHRVILRESSLLLTGVFNCLCIRLLFERIDA